MVEGTNSTHNQDEEARARELLEHHKKIKHHIDLLAKVASEMDEVDIVYKIWGWLDEAGIAGGDRPQKLAELLASFEESLFNHFEREERDLLPVLDKRGATEFSAKLQREHETMRKAFRTLDRKIKTLAAPPRNDRDSLKTEREPVSDRRPAKDDAKKVRLEQSIRDSLDKLLKDVERHALEEEDAFFSMGHNV